MQNESNNPKEQKTPQKNQHQQEKSEKKRLKPRRTYKRRPKSFEKIQQEINDQDFEWDDNDQFIIQRIIDEQVWENKRYYLVKWKGFDISMSTWEQAAKFKDMADLIDEYRRTKKGKRDKNISEVANKMMNPYRATQVHGHFLYGDEPKQIVNTIVQFDADGKKTIYLEISWKNRSIPEGEMYLQNSIIQSDIVFDHNPNFLLNYYQKAIQLKSIGNQ